MDGAVADGAAAQQPAGRGGVRAAETRGLGPPTLMAAGLGWVGGTFAWPGPQWTDQVAITVVHVVPVAIVVVAVWALASGTRAGWARAVLTGIACLIKVTTIVAVFWVVAHPVGFGPHGLLDWVPLGMANAGGGLWLKSVITSRRWA